MISTFYFSCDERELIGDLSENPKKNNIDI